MEQRQTRAVRTEFQTREENGEKHITGYFAVFNSNYEIAPGLTESVMPGAFDRTLDGDIRALTDHDTRLVLGRSTAGTLTLRADSHGLWGDILVNPNDQDAMNTYARVQRGDVNQCSFGFDIVNEDAEYRDDGSVHWTIREVKLYEVSVVTFPAYKETNVNARSEQVADHKARELQAWKARMKGVLGHA